MMGSEIRPIEITEAATTPVVAASSAPTKITAIGQAATHRAEQLADGVEQVFGHAGSLEDQPHEGEEGDGEQRVVGHDAEDTFRQCLEERRGEQAEFDADQTEDDAVGGQGESHRVAEEQEA
jgi:hypothetical protein